MCVLFVIVSRHIIHRLCLAYTSISTQLISNNRAVYNQVITINREPLIWIIKTTVASRANVNFYRLQCIITAVRWEHLGYIEFFPFPCYCNYTFISSHIVKLILLFAGKTLYIIIVSIYIIHQASSWHFSNKNTCAFILQFWLETYIVPSH